MARVFISHSSRDNSVATEMMEWLRSQGFDRAFLDIDKHAGIPPGAQWERQLYQEIERAQAVILVLTPNWLDSKWCFAEFTQARALGKSIFPVIIAPGGESFIAPDIQNLDLRSDHEGGLERLSRELTRLALDAQGGFDWDPARAPYPGLMSFEEEDAAIFFGRDDDSRALIERLNARRVQGQPKLVALLGASGSGKSSLLRAGVLPRLRRDRRNWIVLPPFRPRLDPPVELARAAAEALGTPEDWRAWHDRFLSEARVALDDLADRLRIRAQAREAQILLSVDQGEELFAINAPENAARLLTLIKEAVAEDSPFMAVLALRSDYLGQLQKSAAGVFRFQEYSLAPMPLDRVRHIIEGPARVAGVKVEDALVAAATRDAGTEDALPLLAFTLRELYDRYASAGGSGTGGSDRQLLLAHYGQLADPAAGLNPLENSVRRRADEVTHDVDAGDLEALRNCFVEGLVRVNSEGEYVRRPARWDELPERARPLLERLAGARLLVIGEEGGQRTVEVAHEALLRKWPRLTGWLDHKREFLVGKTQLERMLADWHGAADADKATALLQGLFLRRAERWLVEHPRALSDAERTYIKESLRREAENVRRRRLVTIGSIAAVIAFVAVIGVLLLRSVQARRAVAAAQQRTTASLHALDSRTALQAGETERAVTAAVEAYSVLPTAETRSALLQSVMAVSPNLSRSLSLAKLDPRFVAWLPGSDRLLVGGLNGRILSWRPSAGFSTEEVHTPGEGAFVPPALRGLAAAGADRAVAMLEDGRLIRFEVGKANGTASTSIGAQADLASLGPSGTLALVASSAEGAVGAFDCRSAAGCKKVPLASGYATALALDEGSARAAVSLEDGGLSVFDLDETVPARRRVELPTRARIQSLAYDRAGERLAVGTTEGELFVVDAEGRARQVNKETSSITALAWNPADQRLAFTCGFSVCTFSVPPDGAAPSEATRWAGHANTVVSLAWAAQGDRLASASTDGTVKLWENGSVDRVARTLAAPDAAALTDLDVSADRQWIAAGTAGGAIHVWETRSLKLAGSLPPAGRGAEVRALRWHPERPWIAQADRYGAIVVRGWPDGKTVGSVELGSEFAETILWTPSGASLLAGLSSGRVVEWAPGGQPAPFDRAHSESANSLAVDPQGARLVSSDSRGDLWLWDVRTRKFARALAHLDEPVGTVAFNTAGTLVLAAGNSGTLVLYDAETPHAEVWRPSPGGAQIESASFSPDDRSVASVNVEGYLHVWSIPRREIEFSVKVYPDGAPAASGADEGRAGHLSEVVWLPELPAMAVATARGELKVISTEVADWLARARSVFNLPERTAESR